MIYRVSRMACVLSKMAASVPAIPGLTGENNATLTPHGTEGRMLNLMAPRTKMKMMQGPRAYAPRTSTPSP